MTMTTQCATVCAKVGMPRRLNSACQRASRIGNNCADERATHPASRAGNSDPNLAHGARNTPFASAAVITSMIGGRWPPLSAARAMVTIAGRSRRSAMT